MILALFSNLNDSLNLKKPERCSFPPPSHLRAASAVGGKHCSLHPSCEDSCLSENLGVVVSFQAGGILITQRILISLSYWKIRLISFPFPKRKKYWYDSPTLGSQTVSASSEGNMCLCQEEQTCFSAIDSNFKAFSDGEIAGFCEQRVGLQSDCDRIAIWLHPWQHQCSLAHSWVLNQMKSSIHRS